MEHLYEYQKSRDIETRCPEDEDVSLPILSYVEKKISHHLF